MRIEELMDESFNSTYQYKTMMRHPSREEYQVISDEINSEFSYTIDIYTDSGDAELVFKRVSRSGDYEIGTTNDSAITGVNAVKLLSTVIKIAGESKIIKTTGSFIFSSNDAKKVALYISIVKRMGYRVIDGGSSFRGYKVIMK
jgi:hypothetical protein